MFGVGHQQGRVVSGHNASLDVVQEAAIKKGALKAARLAVSGAFHTPLMGPAREALVKVRDIFLILLQWDGRSAPNVMEQNFMIC